MSELTAAMGIASPSLYAAFGSKEGLYREAIDHYVSTYGGASGAMEAPTAREGVERLLRGAVAQLHRRRGPISGCMVMQTAAMAGDLSPELAASLCAIRAGTAEHSRAAAAGRSRRARSPPGPTSGRRRLLRHRPQGAEPQRQGRGVARGAGLGRDLGDEGLGR
jgi:AcrR family transcriptional regulator